MFLIALAAAALNTATTAPPPATVAALLAFFSSCGILCQSAVLVLVRPDASSPFGCRAVIMFSMRRFTTTCYSSYSQVK